MDARLTENGQRVGGIAGLAFVLLFVTLFVIHPDSGETNREILAYYEDSGNRTKEYISSAIAALASIALLFFAGTMAAPSPGAGERAPGRGGKRQSQLRAQNGGARSLVIAREHHELS